MPDLYRMYSRRNVLLYVGISTNAAGRAAQHATTKPWWPDVTRITVDHLDCDWTTALGYEKRAILNEKPLHNIQHNDPDLYVERIEIKPFDVPFDLIDTPEWAALQRALMQIQHLAYRKYGIRTLTELHTYQNNYGPNPITIDFLNIIEATARAAHLTIICTECGDEQAPTHASIRQRRTQLEDTKLVLTAMCRTCYRTTVREINWEQA